MSQVKHFLFVIGSSATIFLAALLGYCVPKNPEAGVVAESKYSVDINNVGSSTADVSIQITDHEAKKVLLYVLPPQIESNGHVVQSGGGARLVGSIDLSSVGESELKVELDGSLRRKIASPSDNRALKKIGE